MMVNQTEQSCQQLFGGTWMAALKGPVENRDKGRVLSSNRRCIVICLLVGFTFCKRVYLLKFSMLVGL